MPLSDIVAIASGQEIISNKEAEEHEIINDVLKVVLDLHLLLEHRVLQVEILLQNTDINKLEHYIRIVFGGGNVDSLGVLIENKLLPDNAQVLDVEGHAQHNEICIGPVQAMLTVWVKYFLLHTFSDEIHNLVLSFTRDVPSTENNLELLPVRIFVDLLLNEKPQLLVEFKHELGPWSDAIVFEIFFVFLAVFVEPLFHLSVVFGALIPPGPLIVHLRSRSNSIQSQE